MPTRDFAAIEATLSSDNAPSNQQTFLSVIQAIGANNFAAVSQYLTEDAELNIHGFPHMNGVWRGRVNVIAAMTVNFKKVTEQKPVIQDMVQRDDVLIIRMRETGRFVESKIPYDVDVVLWCTFAKGKIAKVEQFVHYVH
jgi:ketosteroid isomerase-like protein